MRIRARLAWQPSWEGPDHQVKNPPPEYATKQWAISFIGRNVWRCDRIHGADDLLQDAYLTYLRIVSKYPRARGQAHFMSLFRRAIHNEMHDRARYVMRKREVTEDTSVDACELPGRIGEVSNEGYIAVLLEQAPEGLRAALICIAQNPPSLYQATEYRENLNMRLRRVLRSDRKADYCGAIKALLTS